MMNSLEKINHDLAEVTEDLIADSVRICHPVEEGEKVLAVAVSPSVRRLWALAFDYERQGRKLSYSALYDSRDRAELDVMIAQARMIDALGDAVRELAWIEVKNEIGIEAWKAASLGMRDGFTIVSTPVPRGEISIEGVTSVSQSLMEGLQQALGLRERGVVPAKKPKGKVQ